MQKEGLKYLSVFLTLCCLALYDMGTFFNYSISVKLYLSILVHDPMSHYKNSLFGTYYERVLEGISFLFLV